MVDLGSGSQREIDDIILTRYACYLVAARKKLTKIETELSEVITNRERSSIHRHLNRHHRSLAPA